MAFLPKTGPESGKIHTVTIGTGDTAVTIGGNSALAFYTFDAPTENPPAIGVEVSDVMAEELPGLQALYAGCESLAERVSRAASIPGVDFVCLRLEAADPNGENRSVERCAAEAVLASEATQLPLVIMGCQNIDKDVALFGQIAQLLQGRNVLFLSARNENYKAVGAATVLAYGHKVCAETADDVNLAKQLNIMLGDLSIPAESIVMNIGTAAVGYGFDYVASTMDRVRRAALSQMDKDLQMPIIAPVCADTWYVKESTATEADEPAWGDREDRGVEMEVATAAACLTSGADAVILRHPRSIAAVKRFITELS